MANDSPDFFPADDMDAFPKGAIKAMFEPIDDVVDFSSDIWSSSQTLNDSFVFNGKHYVAAIDVRPQYVFTYNTKTISVSFRVCKVKAHLCELAPCPLVISVKLSRIVIAKV